MTSKTEPSSPENLVLQSWLRPALSVVGPNLDHRRMVAELEKIDSVLRRAHLEKQVRDFAMENLRKEKGEEPTWKAAGRAMEFAEFALRAEVLRHLKQLPSFREYSKMLASSDLLADFCGIRTVEGIKWTSKSTLDRASKCFSTEQWKSLCKTLTEVIGKADTCACGGGGAGLAEAVDVSVVLGDSTCLEANIHYPVDWVLLKDVALTLIRSIRLVRSQGLLNRMESRPEELARGMNRLFIAMTHSARQKDGRKKRKAVFREMKKLLRRGTPKIRQCLTLDKIPHSGDPKAVSTPTRQHLPPARAALGYGPGLRFRTRTLCPIPPDSLLPVAGAPSEGAEFDITPS